MFDLTQNYVRTAIDRVGGATKAAHLTSVSNATVHLWLNNGRIPNIDRAKIIAAEARIDIQLLRGTR